MGQVPERASFLLVGDGRLASHLSHFFRIKNLEFSHWSRRQGVIASGDGDERGASLEDLIARADRVLLAIRDDAIADFVEQHRRDTSSLWVHFSGSTVTSTVIDGAWSAHPLCTFAESLYDLATYEGIPFIVEREGPSFAELLPGLANPSASIPREAKALYHALCVSAGNFTQLLWQQLFSVFETQLGLEPDLALPYLRQTSRNLAQNAGKNVLTGPLARRDLQTIEHNLAALRDARRPELVKVYEAFLELADIKTLEVA